MKPIIALTGPNETLKRDFLEKHLKKTPRDSIETFYADDIEPGRVFGELSAASLFGSEMVLVVKNIDAMTTGQKRKLEEGLLDYCSHINTAYSLILLAESFSAQLTAKLREAGEVLEFGRMYRADVIRWITERLKTDNIVFDPDVPDFVTTMANEDAEAAEALIGPLIAYGRSVQRLTVDGAEAILARSNNMSIFDLVGGIFSRKAGRALHALGDLRLLGESAIRINTMILRTARHLWGYLAMPDKQAAAAELKIKPFEMKKLAEYARVCDLKFVSAALETCQRVEITAKTMPEEFAFLELECFILETGR